MDLTSTVKLKFLNPQITCPLCKGYFIDATTIPECVHTFCKSCIVKYLENNNKCPTCDQMIHQSHPLNFIMYDRTMQDIVNKLVPGLQQRERDRKKAFYTQRNLEVPPDCYAETNGSSQAESSPSVNHGSNGCLTNGSTTASAVLDEAEERRQHEEEEALAQERGARVKFHKLEPQIAVVMTGEGLDTIERNCFLTSVNATITVVKKYVAKKLFDDGSRFRDLDIFCEDELMGREHSLKFIAVTRWRCKEFPLRLTYRPHVETS